MDLEIGRAVLGGVVGAIAMTAVMYMGSMMGRRMDMPARIETVLAEAGQAATTNPPLALREAQAMMWLKGCPRCRGDLAEGDDLYGRYVHCLQCARELTDAQAQELLIFGRLTEATLGRGPVTIQKRGSVLVNVA